MKSAAWFAVGWMFAYQVNGIIPVDEGMVSIISNFILQPLSFLEGAIFIFAAFIIFSYSLRQALVALIQLASEKRRKAIVYGIIGSIIVLSSWIILIFHSLYITLLIDTLL